MVHRGNTGKQQAKQWGTRKKTANRLSECTLESHCRSRRGEWRESQSHISRGTRRTVSSDESEKLP